MTNQRNYVRLECPFCLQPQELTAEGVPDDTAISCSYCGGPLGDWRRLKRENSVALARH